MNQLAEYLVRHGYWVLFVAVICRQACLPVPTNLLLLVAGALAGLGRLNPVAIVLHAVVAFILADLAWYEAGHKWGTKTLHFFCKAAPNPQACVDRMFEDFNRHGVKSLFISKFIIGLDSITSPLSGASGIHRSKFLLFDGIGAFIWVCAYMAVGYTFRYRIDHFAAYSNELGATLAMMGLCVLIVLVIRRLIHWYRFLREFRLTQITPDQLLDKLRMGGPVLLLDLQGDVGSTRKLGAIPGAIRIDPRQLQFYVRRYRHVDVKTNREVILYSSCSRNSTDARVALALKKRGFEKVRPLAGGLRAWRERGFPVTSDVQMLPATEHAVFVLREVLQHSRDSAARLLAKNASEVDQILERVKRRLRRWHAAERPLPRDVPAERP